MAIRYPTAIFIASLYALGSIVVTELFFQNQRGTKTGWWKFAFTLGTPAGPFIMGFVTMHRGLRWTFLTFAFFDFAVFLDYLFFGPETLYDHDILSNNVFLLPLSFFKFKLPYSRCLIIGKLLIAFMLASSIRIFVPICASTIVFAYANIDIIILVPASFGIKFNLDLQGISLQFIGLIIGLVLGEQVSGRGSNLWMKQ
jgi:hypothetical protein